MAKKKESDGKQKSIKSFFGGDRHEGDSSSDVDVPAQPSKADGGKIDASNLPPMHDIPSIFNDLISHIPEIKEVAEIIRGRKLRVATMCSGTESPLLAIELCCQSIAQQYDVKLDVEHVFSCEIEPFKQAYIERNFHPPLLFRDVCELGEEQATTAYGSLATVPGDVDLLVAGTSCVDYSNLNNEKQDIDGNGESGRTFRGMMSWVKTHRPPLVILENVCSAPWDRVVEYFQKNGYSAIATRLDTKQYYIPHTRTRGYLLAVNQRKSRIPDAWKDCLSSKLKRQASSTLDAFLLPSDDPRIHQARQKLVRESYNALDRRTGRTDWGRCESRHQRARLDEALGPKRPLTSWDEGGFCKMPDFAWGDWAVGQVERVWDLMDILTLRSAKIGVDPSYKSQVWNLSQNVDRNAGSAKPGICPCLTPSMIPYVSNRGGPLVGLEALSMQGLPIDKLLLTRETEDQLADLAGNAMSTTVVGAAILAALVVGKKLLKAGDDTQTYEMKDNQGTNTDTQDAMDVDVPEKEAAPGLIEGDGQLLRKPLDLSAVKHLSLSRLLLDAQRSVRLCDCEGRNDITNRTLLRCKDCGSSCCDKCGGRPDHNYEPIDAQAIPRSSPSIFAKNLKSSLPMCLQLTNITEKLLDDLKESSGVSIPQKRWIAWRSAVTRVAKTELRFVEPKRQEIWSTTYESTAAYLELLLHPQQTEWRLYAKPDDSEPANAEIRQLLQIPVARFTCRDNLLTGSWQFALPHTISLPITIEGIGELVPSWEARLGLTGDEFRNRVVHSRLQISVRPEDAVHFDRNIAGEYMLLDKCGTANSALHKKVALPDEAALPPLFMLLDPVRCGDPAADCFVFSISKRRYEYGEHRPIICKLSTDWRQSDAKGPQSVICHVPMLWVESSAVTLKPSTPDNAFFSVPGDVLQIEVQNEACASANALLECRVPLRSDEGAEWPRGEWREVDKVHERSTFKRLAWLMERVREIEDHYSSWQTVDTPENLVHCERCAPTTPTLKWSKIKKKVAAVEDPVQAGQYERNLKARPSPFITQLKMEEGVGTVRVGINIASLLHRALSRLATAGRPVKPVLSWRLDADFTSVVKIDLPKFKLSSNKSDSQHAQPPSFKTLLRPEQLRSLTWMLRQEAADAPPFVEEEIAEAILEPLGWRAEARAQRPVRVRGGVLADEVGYGKTAITLGLIDCASEDVQKEFSKADDILGKINVKATLAIVPPHLTRQWASEAKKFAGSRFKTVVISTATNINSLTIEEVQKADIVIVASNLFHSSVYLANLESFSGGGALPAQDGRYFNARLDRALEALKHQVDLLKTEGSGQVMKRIQDARRHEDELENQIFVAPKRLKGRSYRETVQSVPGKEEIKSEKEYFPAKRTPSGLTVEVLLPAIKHMKPNKTQPLLPSDDMQDDEDPDKPMLRSRRASKKTPIVLSDDEDEEDDVDGDDDDDDDDEHPVRSKTAGKLSLSSRLKHTKIASSSSDYEENSEELSDEVDQEFSQTSDDDISDSDRKQNTKLKQKAKSKQKPGSKRVSKSISEEADSSMDIDEASSSASIKSSKKRKAADDKEASAKKQKRREDTDPWGLESRAVKNDWTQMRAPPLDMFHFARIVVDEYTYLDGKDHALVTRLTANRHWVLSGTPPIHDFGALKTIAAFLHLHLGIDDDGEGQSLQVKKRRREQTAVEKFHSFREVHSTEWHGHRHLLGQSFLDHFVRQNIAEIDEIPSTFKIEKINLPAAERAIYLELEHHLRALDMTIKRGKKTESDREKRLAKSLGESNTAEEALLKRCSHFDLDTTDKENAMKACEVIVKERTKQLDDCKTELVKKLKEALQMEKSIGKVPDESMFQEYVRVSRAEGVGDKDATEIVTKLLDDAGVPVSSAFKNKGKGKDDVQVSSKVKDMIWKHREQTHDIRRLTKELTGRVRSLRYFTVVRDLQKQQETPPKIPCPVCQRDQVPMDEVAVLSSCGHMGCVACVKACAEREECVYSASGACRAAARVLNIIKGDTLGVDDLARDGRGKHFGMKLEKMIHLIKKRIPSDERILVFVQFPDLMKKVAEALSGNKVKFLEIRGSATQKSKNLEKFQNDSEERVLLLNVMDESASGANLTSANHAVFLSPLLAPTQEIYNACETQAIGRLRRYGQTKHVYIWRFLTLNTIDVEIFEQRSKQKV